MCYAMMLENNHQMQPIWWMLSIEVRTDSALNDQDLAVDRGERIHCGVFHNTEKT